MDKTKLILGSIIGIMLSCGIFAAAFEYNANIRVQVNDAAWTKANADATASGKTIDQITTESIQSSIEQPYITELTERLATAETSIKLSGDITKLEAATLCMEAAAR